MSWKMQNKLSTGKWPDFLMYFFLTGVQIWKQILQNWN